VDGADAEAGGLCDLQDAVATGKRNPRALELLGLRTWAAQLCPHDARLALKLAVAGELVFDHA